MLGVPVRVRGSALLTLAALWVLLYLQLTPGLAWRAWWLAPLITSLTCVGFLGSVVAHELAHALVARGLGLEVTEVSVLHVGGMTRLAREPSEPRDEALIAAAGPAVNILLAGGLLLVGVALGPTTTAGGLWVFLAYLNGTLGVFNLLPGHPLDGGALVRSAVWAMTGDAVRSLRVSGLLGQGLGLAMVLAGVVGVLPSGPVPADPAWLWVAVVGAFVAAAARVGVLHAGVRLRLEGLVASDLSRTAPFDVPARAMVATVVATVSRADRPGLVLDTRGEALGTFGPHEVAAVPHGAWDHATVGEHMRPVVGSVEAGTELLSVLGQFRRTRDSVLAVLSNGRPVATLTASDVLDHLDGE